MRTWDTSKKRLVRGDRGINPLDEACKEHDIKYSQFEDIEKRHEADKILADKALQRFSSPDSKLGEKIAALGVAGVMKAKTKLGMGVGRRQKKGGRRKGLTLNEMIKRARKDIIGKPHTSLKKAAQMALASIKKGKRHVVQPKQRIIPIPKTGGFLPLIPLFAGLPALGALGGGAAGIAKAVNDAKDAKQKLEEEKRHNKTMEEIAIAKGLYLRLYKQGLGLYLKPFTKNCQ